MNKLKLLKSLDTFIVKSRKDWLMYHRTADMSVPKVRREFIEATNKLQKSVSVSKVEQTLQKKNVNKTLAAIDWNSFEDDLKNISHTLSKVFLRGLSLATKELRKVDVKKIEVKTSLTIRNELAEEFIEENTALLISTVGEETKQGIRAIVLNGFQTGKAPREMAREIKKLIGITGRQAIELANLDAKLSDMLARGKSPFKTVPLTQGKIDGIINKKTQQLLRRRAETISRTETIRASNAGQYDLWQSAIDDGLLSETVEVKWSTAGDERVCPWCGPLDGEVVGFKEPFSSGVKQKTTGKTVTLTEVHPPLHQSCRCALVLDL